MAKLQTYENPATQGERFVVSLEAVWGAYRARGMAEEVSRWATPKDRRRLAEVRRHALDTLEDLYQPPSLATLRRIERELGPTRWAGRADMIEAHEDPITEDDLAVLDSYGLAHLASVANVASNGNKTIKDTTTETEATTAQDLSEKEACDERR